MITFDSVGLRYGQGPEILRDLTFHLEKGSFHFLTGASGAGKTSLLKLMYLGLRPTRGRIRMLDVDLHTTKREQLAKLRTQIGVVFQDFRLLSHLSAFDNVALPLRIMNKEEKDIKAHVSELLHWVGLGDYMNAKPSTLSGGQQQRIAIARAVINRPRILLADEPTGNLDKNNTDKIINFLIKTCRKNNTSLLMVTHDTELLTKFDKVYSLESGVLV